MGLFRRKKSDDDRNVSVWRELHGREGFFVPLNVTAANAEAQRILMTLYEREGREPVQSEIEEATLYAYANPENFVDLDHLTIGSDDQIGIAELDPETGEFIQFAAWRQDDEIDEFDTGDGPEITQELVDQILAGDFSAFDIDSSTSPEAPTKKRQLSPEARAKRQAEIDAIRASYENDAQDAN